jgi:hypothetical protein
MIKIILKYEASAMPAHDFQIEIGEVIITCANYTTNPLVSHGTERFAALAKFSKL